MRKRERKKQIKTTTTKKTKMCDEHPKYKPNTKTNEQYKYEEMEKIYLKK